MNGRIKVVGYVPTQGGYTALENASEQEQAWLSERIVKRMGKALEDYMNRMEDDR